MQEEITACPVCKGEIAVEQKQCNWCGALFAPGSSMGKKIQKGIICHSCNQRTYSVEICNHCNHPLSVKCPSCAKLIGLHESQCPHCNQSIKKYGKYHRLRTRPLIRWPRLASLGGLLLILTLAIVFAFSEPIESVKRDIDTPLNPKPIDRDYDGQIDRWEHFSEAGVLERIENDANNNGVSDRWTYFDGSGQKTRTLEDIDENGIYEQKQTYWPNGNIRKTTIFAKDDQEVTLEWRRYRPDGGKIEEATDSDGDRQIDRYYKYTPEGKKYLEGHDTDQDGRLDKYLTINQFGKTVQTSLDIDGNDIFEKITGTTGDGMKIWEAFDENQDGLIEKKIYYHADGQVRWIEYDQDKDGNHEITESFTKRGALARTGIDLNGDTKPDRWK